MSGASPCRVIKQGDAGFLSTLELLDELDKLWSRGSCRAFPTLLVSSAGSRVSGSALSDSAGVTGIGSVTQEVDFSALCSEVVSDVTVPSWPTPSPSDSSSLSVRGSDFICDNTSEFLDKDETQLRQRSTGNNGRFPYRPRLRVNRRVLEAGVVHWPAIRHGKPKPKRF